MTREEAIEYLKRADITVGQKIKTRTAEALEMAIEALQTQLKESPEDFNKDSATESMLNADLISRQAVLDILDRHTLSRMALYEIEDLPSVQPQTVGKWILLDECSNSGYYCSECHKRVVKEGWSNTVKKIKYCPNCGAKMEECE